MATAHISEETLPGSTISFSLSRKAIRRVYLRVRRDDGKLLISAPHALPLSHIHEFIRQHQDWITAQQSRRKSLPAPDFSRVILWGKPLTVHWRVNGKRSHVHQEGDRLYCTLPEGKTDNAARQALLDRILRQALTTAIAHRLPHWCAITGHAQPSVGIRRMTSRWGSCHITRRRLSINLILAQYPAGCLDLVLVHELSHFDERLHNARFYQQMDNYFPDWRAWESVLRAPPSAACAAGHEASSFSLGQ